MPKSGVIPRFPVFRLILGISPYSVQMLENVTPNTDTFHTVANSAILKKSLKNLGRKLIISSFNKIQPEGRSEGTSSVAVEVLIVNHHMKFINLFISNCLTPNINLFIFNCLTSSFCFPKHMSIASRRERLLIDARP